MSVNNFTLKVASNNVIAGTKKIVTTIKLKEYVPMKDKIWRKDLISTMLKEIKFQGNPPNTWPLKYSINEKITANIRMLSIFFLGLKKWKIKKDIP